MFRVIPDEKSIAISEDTVLKKDKVDQARNNSSHCWLIIMNCSSFSHVILSEISGPACPLQKAKMAPCQVVFYE